MQDVSFSLSRDGMFDLNNALLRLVQHPRVRRDGLVFLPPDTERPRRMLAKIIEQYGRLPFAQCTAEAMFLSPGERLRISITPDFTTETGGGATIQIWFEPSFPDDLSRDLAIGFLCALEHTAKNEIRPALAELLESYAPARTMGSELPVG